ncbi:MAG: tetratricopeptide repeat protein, partial [Myxococcota bacterium]
LWPDGVPPAMIETPTGATRATTPSPGGFPDSAPNTVYLKQSGQIYSVRDWDTLRRWIGERRVDRNDLVSEGGVRWEPIGGRPELAALFRPEPVLPSPTPVPAAATVLPFGGDTPFGAPAGPELWSDDDTEGVPVGLPPLPTDAGPDDSVFRSSMLTPSLIDELESTGGLHLGVQYDPTDEIEALGDGDYGLAEDDDDRETEAMMPVPVEDEPGTVIVSETPVPADDLESFDALEISPVGGEGPVSRAFERTTNLARMSSKASPLSAPPAPLAARDRALATAPPAVPLRPLDGGPLDGGAITQPVAIPRPDEFPFEQEWVEANSKPPSRWMWAAAVALTAVFGVVVIGWVLSTHSPAPTPPPMVVPKRETVEGAPTPAVTPAGAVAPAAPGARRPPMNADAVRAGPAEPPAEPPREPPALPVTPGPSSAELTEKAWALAEDDRDKAAKLFRQALDQDPDNDDANYGYGYVLLMTNHRADAVRYLCKARNAGDPEIRQDVNGMIRTHDLTCP